MALHYKKKGNFSRFEMNLRGEEGERQVVPQLTLRVDGKDSGPRDLQGSVCYHILKYATMP